MNNVSDRSLFANEIVHCISSAEIADKFFHELTESERSEIIDFTEHKSIPIGGGKGFLVFDGIGRGIIVEDLYNVENKTEKKLIQSRIVTLEIDLWDE